MHLDTRFLNTTRGQIVAELRRESRTVEDLRKMLGITDNAVRAHLAALERDGIVHQTATRLVDSLSDRMSPDQLEIILRDVGERLAKEQPSLTGTLRERTEGAARVLTTLGGLAEVEESNDALTIRGYSCPLADAVRSHPATCQAAQALVSELVGAPVTEACDKGLRPRCRFTIAKNGNDQR
jgi:predicted ArsR family transcriptional regulator